jgi:hypothetical protein
MIGAVVLLCLLVCACELAVQWMFDVSIGEEDD